MRDFNTIVKRLQVGLPVTEKEYNVVLERTEEIKRFRHRVGRAVGWVVGLVFLVMVSGHIYFWLK